MSDPNWLLKKRGLRTAPTPREKIDREMADFNSKRLSKLITIRDELKQTQEDVDRQIQEIRNGFDSTLRKKPRR
jgi:hypothetical protein